MPDDCVLMPGLVDSHVHVNEPGRTEWEGFATATARGRGRRRHHHRRHAAQQHPADRRRGGAGGQAGGRAATRRASTSAFWGGAVPGNLDDLEALHDAGVVGFKCFLLPSGVDEFPPLDGAQLRAAMTRIASFGGLLIAHAEDAASIDPAVARDRADLPQLPGLPPAGRRGHRHRPSAPGDAARPAAGPTSCTCRPRPRCPRWPRPRPRVCR